MVGGDGGLLDPHPLVVHGSSEDDSMKAVNTCVLLLYRPAPAWPLAILQVTVSRESRRGHLLYIIISLHMPKIMHSREE